MHLQKDRNKLNLQVRFYVHHRGRNLGPYDFNEIERRLENRSLDPVDYVYLADRKDWISIPEFISIYNPKPASSSSNSDSTFLVEMNPFPEQPQVPPPTLVSSTLPDIPPPLSPPEKSHSAVVYTRVHPAPATRFEFLPLGPLTAGKEFTVEVRALDEYGNLAGHYQGEVEIKTNLPLHGNLHVEIQNGRGQTRLRCLQAGILELTLA